MKWLVALCALFLGSVEASPPIDAKLTACVLDGVVITSDGFPIHLVGRHVDLAALAGKRIRITGDVQPGDLVTVTADIELLGTCSATEKLAMLSSLARVYREQVDRDNTPPAPKSPPVPKRAPVDCADRTCYEVLRVPKAGGAPVVVRSGTNLVGHIFVDKNYVYWSEGTIGAWNMMRQPKGKGLPTAIAHGAYRGEIVRGADGFYGIVDGGLAALPDNKPSHMLVPGVTSEVAVDADHVYYTDDGPENSTSLWSIPMAGGASQPLAVGEPVATAPFVANGELYWANINVPPTGGGQLRHVAVGGGIVRTLVETQPKMTAWALTADARAVYWVEWGGAGYELYRAPKDGGKRTLLGVAPAEVMNRDNRDHVEVDATHAYWNARESIARVAKGGGTVEEIVRLARGDVMSFAMDDTDVYVAVVIF